MKICENCREKSMCDPIIHECPMIDFKGITYKFNNSKGEEFIAEFKNRDDAQDFAYRAGLCFLGRL